MELEGGLKSGISGINGVSLEDCHAPTLYIFIHSGHWLNVLQFKTLLSLMQVSRELPPALILEL